MPEISKELWDMVDRLDPEEGDLERKFKRVLEHEIRHRLSQYLLTDQLLWNGYSFP